MTDVTALATVATVLVALGAGASRWRRIRHERALRVTRETVLRLRRLEADRRP